jgi:hypothetical protein
MIPMASGGNRVGYIWPGGIGSHDKAEIWLASSKDISVRINHNNIATITEIHSIIYKRLNLPRPADKGWCCQILQLRWRQHLRMNFDIGRAERGATGYTRNKWKRILNL